MKILVIGPAWVGDMVMSQSLYKLLKQRQPEAGIQVLAPAWTRPLLERMPEVSRARDMPLGHGRLALSERWRLGRALRAEGFGQAIVLPNSFKSALVPLFARIPRRSGWRGEARSWILNDCRVLDKARYPLMVQRFAALGLAPGAALPDMLPEPALATRPEDVAALRAKFALAEGAALALCPGAEFGPSKQWPPGHYAALAARAIDEGKQIWLFGSANDQQAAADILAALTPAQRERCSDFTGRTTLGEAIDLLSQAQAVVSNDSGLMHVAAALERPLVVVYGSSSPGFTPPLASRVRTLALGLDCSPCFARRCPLGHHRCMRELDPDRVWRALAELAGERESLTIRQ